MIERFELLDRIGRGGMGVVWKARDTESGDIVAIKLLHNINAADPEYIARLEREVEIARRIESPRCVTALGLGRREGIPYLVMEFVEGKSLRDLQQEKGKLPWDEAKRITRQVAEGLAAAHAAGVIHRDIKPGNILVTADGSVKLVDFGISRANDLTSITGTSTQLGTPAYMAPDSLNDERSDLYSLGVVLYEMLAGAPPFGGESQAEVVVQHIRNEPKLDVLPAAAQRIVVWLLQKDPNARPQSAAALEGVLAGTATPPRNTQRFILPGEPVKRRRMPVLVGSLVLLPVVVGASVMAGIAMGGEGGDDNESGSSPVSTSTPAPFTPITGGADDSGPTATAVAVVTGSCPPKRWFRTSQRRQSHRKRPPARHQPHPPRNQACRQPTPGRPHRLSRLRLRPRELRHRLQPAPPLQPRHRREHQRPSHLLRLHCTSLV